MPPKRANLHKKEKPHFKKEASALLERISLAIEATSRIRQHIVDLLQRNCFIASQERFIKTQSHFPDSGHERNSMTQLKLCGKWLREAGFEPNMYVKITVEPGMLIITPMENAPEVA